MCVGTLRCRCILYIYSYTQKYDNKKFYFMLKGEVFTFDLLDRVFFLLTFFFSFYLFSYIADFNKFVSIEH